MFTSTKRPNIKSAPLAALLKLELIIMILYEGWYLEKFSAIPLLLQGLSAMIIGTTGLLLLKNRSYGKDGIIKYWVFFGVYSLIAAMIINADMKIVSDSLFTYFAFVAIVFCGGVVSRYTSDYSWFSHAVLLVCIISAFFALFYGFPYKNGSYYVTTMSEFNNPNNLGLIMSIGTFMLLFPEYKPRLFGWAFRTALAFVFLLVTINTGSRSSLICDLAVIAMFIFVRLRNAKGTRVEKLVKNLLLIVGVLATIAIVIVFVFSDAADGSPVKRLIDKFNLESFSGRTDLYDAAWAIYKEHPLFGIGYNCFASVSGFGYFTHSTYMELLSCCGTIGFVLFMTPVLTAVWRSLRAFKQDGGRSATLLLLMLISSFFGIVYYGMVFLMVLYMEMSRLPKKEA